jgi:hypothetical protein
MTILCVTINKIISLYIRDIIEFMISISSMTRPTMTRPTLTRPTMTRPTLTRPTLTRKKSQYFTNQLCQGTCYAHASAILIARLLKIYFSKHFGKEIEWCDYYYNTLLCNDGAIFECFKNDKEKKIILNCKAYITSQKNIDDFLNDKYNEKNDEIYEEFRDKEGWNNENPSALLFYFIYTIITEKYLFKGGNIVLSIILFFEFFRTTIITKEVVAAILKYDITDWEDENDKKYFYTIISQLTTMLLEVQKCLKDGTFNPNLYYASNLNYTIVNPIIIYNYKTYWPSIENSLKITSIMLNVIGHKLATLHQIRPWRKDNMLAIKTFLVSVLEKGLYVIIGVQRKIFDQTTNKLKIVTHSMILNGVEHEDGKTILTIKNSHGRHGNAFLTQEKNNKIEMHTFFKTYKYIFEMYCFDVPTSKKEDEMVYDDSLLYAGGKHKTSKNKKNKHSKKIKLKQTLNK